MGTYQSPKPISDKEAQRALDSEDPSRICDALLRLSLFSADWRVTQNICLRYLKHQDTNARGVAATCLGHLARLHHALDLKIVIPALEDLRRDPLVGGRARDALDDIEMFITRRP